MATRQSHTNDNFTRDSNTMRRMSQTQVWWLVGVAAAFVAAMFAVSMIYSG